MFDPSNTDGLTAAEIDTLNKALAVLVGGHLDDLEPTTWRLELIDQYSTMLAIVWHDGVTARELVTRVEPRAFGP